uniref:Uncharacterized protein n=1 Tax=Rhipicephalus zambeziensis TaxID=60191 RepID=A0A224YRB8_9ACAR
MNVRLNGHRMDMAKKLLKAVVQHFNALKLYILQTRVPRETENMEQSDKKFNTLHSIGLNVSKGALESIQYRRHITTTSETYRGPAILFQHGQKTLLSSRGF